MDLVPVQECRSLEGWSPVQVPSVSKPDETHLVLVNPWVKVYEFVCDCEGFHYRGRCSHQKKAMKQVCFWSTRLRPDLKQSEEQRRTKTCPNCGGETKWVMELDDAEKA